MLFALGMTPSAATATVHFQLLVNCIPLLVSYFTYGIINLEYALWLAIFSGLGIYFGLFMLGKAMKKYDRQSFILFLMAFVISVASILGFYENFSDLVAVK